MPTETRIVTLGPAPRTVRTATGQILHVPEGWINVPPGDPGLTRRIKAAARTWTVQEKKGRKTFSHGVWVAAHVVESIRADLAAERDTPRYAKKREADARRRERDQAEYVQTFRAAVLSFLAFNPRYATLADALALAVAEHATPVGSGTVARTERIPVEERAEAAVIAWMRHQTTAYDQLSIARIKGERREVRRMLAAQSRRLLENYRAGHDMNPTLCPLQKALVRTAVNANFESLAAR